MSEQVPFWVSWYAARVPFELDSPWWISGFACTNDGNVDIIVAAVMASDEEDARRKIIAAHNEPRPSDLDWRFVIERARDWTPFCGRFERGEWMMWL